MPADFNHLIGNAEMGDTGHGHISGAHPAVRPTAFKRAFTNLVIIAFAHAQHVEIAAKRSGETVEITVDDDGPGIPRAQRREAFKAFARLDPARSPDKAGVGLGLTIARDIMRGHGGEVALEDSPAGGRRARWSFPG